MKLTTPQKTALRLVIDNPGRVAARDNNGQSGHWIGFRTLHHKPEARLAELGLVETVTTTATRKDGTEYEVPVLSATPAGYAALGLDAPAPAADEDEVPLPLPERFRRTYEAEFGEIHSDSDSAAYRRVRDHVMNDRVTAPRWLLGHLADVAALLAELVDEDDETPAPTRAARRRGCDELLDTLRRHGAQPWPRLGHRVRPWGDEPAHCEDCAERIGPRPPAAVVEAEATVDADRATRQAAYEEQLAAELLNAEAQIAAQYGEHMRPTEPVLYTDPSGKQTVAVVQSVYWRGTTAAADVLLATTGQTGSVSAEQLAPLPPLPDMGEVIEGRWLITDKTGRELARVSGNTRAEAHAAARRIPAVREAERRDGGLASRPLWTSDLVTA